MLFPDRRLPLAEQVAWNIKNRKFHIAPENIKERSLIQQHKNG